MKTIDKLFKSLEEMGVKFKKKDEFISFLFEYAYQKLEHKNIKKTKRNMNMLIGNKLFNIYQYLEYYKDQGNPVKLIINSPDKDWIPEMLKYEDNTGFDALAEGILFKKTAYKNV